jgi:predicted nucleic acid-binding protein
MNPRIEFYLDANVILDWLEAARGNKTSEFIRDQIRAETDLLCVVSTFALMEAVQQHQDSAHFRSLVSRGYVPNEVRNHPRDLTPSDCARCYSDVFRLVQSLKTKAVLRKIDATEIWTEATSLQQRANFSAPDAIHVGIALATACDFFVTADQQLLNEIRKLPRRSNPLIPLQTQRGDIPPKFKEQFQRLVSQARKRKASRPQKKVPEEFQDLIGAVRPIFSREKDPRAFVRRYEYRLRRTSRTTQPKRQLVDH